MRNFWIALSILLSFPVSKVNAWRWELVGFPDKPVVAIGIHPSDPQLLYAFVRDTAHWTFLYKSMDDGCTWDSLLYIFAGEGIVIDPICPRTVYAYGCTLLLKTTNQGFTWENIGEELDLGYEYATLMLDFTVNPVNTDILYTSTWTLWTSRFYIYTNNNWQLISNEWTNRGLSVIDAVSDTLIYAGLFYPCAVVKSLDGGWTWESTDFPHDNFGVSDLCVNRNLNQHVLVTTTDSGVYKTMDGGLNWEQCNTGLMSLKLTRVRCRG